MAVYINNITTTGFKSGIPVVHIQQTIWLSVLNNGLIIQWGRAYNAMVDVYYPIIFPAGCGCLVITANSNINYWPSCWVGAAYPNYFDWDGTGTAPSNPNRNIWIYWLAIGY